MRPPKCVRLQRRLEAGGDAALVHRLRGRPSNRKADESLRQAVLDAYASRYHDFGPTFAREKLAQEGLHVERETLRRWLLDAGLWDHERRRDPHRSRRPRRACFGELVQIDASIHDWLEGRGETLGLIAMIDDATGRVEARFFREATVRTHMELLRLWLLRHGRPRALYSDRHSIFEVHDKGLALPDAETQFGRALRELGIDLIRARSPQAKGRVERLFGTAQDRWVKELRLAGVTTCPEANRAFGKRPAEPEDAHRPLGPSHERAAILSVQETRVVANDYTVRFRNRLYQLLPPPYLGLRKGEVVVEQRLDDTMAIRFGDHYLPYRDITGTVRLGGPAPKPPEFTASTTDASGAEEGPAPEEGTGPTGTRPPVVRVALLQSPVLPAARPRIAPGGSTVQPKITPTAGGSSLASDTTLTPDISTVPEMRTFLLCCDTPRIFPVQPSSSPISLSNRYLPNGASHRQGVLPIVTRIPVLPTLLTLGNGVCGFAAIAYASKIIPGDTMSRDVKDSYFMLSAGLILVAMLFDVLDGYAARLSRTASEFGGQLDSLCDAVSFGAAPAFLLLRLGQEWSDHTLVAKLIAVIAALYLACAILRLARFNVENDPDPAAHKRFKGLPSPAAAGCVASLAALRAEYTSKWTDIIDPNLIHTFVQFWAPVGTLIAALLMVSGFSYPHFSRQLRGRKQFRAVVQAVFILAMVALTPHMAFFLLFWAYALSAPFRYFIGHLRRHQDVPEHQPRLH